MDNYFQAARLLVLNPEAPFKRAGEKGALNRFYAAGKQGQARGQRPGGGSGTRLRKGGDAVGEGDGEGEPLLRD